MNVDSNLLLALLILTLLAFIVSSACWHSRMDRRANSLFEKWRNSSLNAERSRLREEIALELENWKSEEELRIRADALNRSDHTHFGKMTEHLVPWLANLPFDPRDMRFLGSPLDLMVFDGLSAGGDITIVFLEVKSGKSRLTPREERLKEAVIAKRVRYRLQRVGRPDARSRKSPEN